MGTTAGNREVPIQDDDQLRVIQGGGGVNVTAAPRRMRSVGPATDSGGLRKRGTSTCRGRWSWWTLPRKALPRGEALLKKMDMEMGRHCR